MPDPFARYDIWKSSPPEGEYRPFKCSGCHDRIEDPDRNEGDIHCYDEDTGEPAGTLSYDWSWDWRDEDPNIP
jgi:hypothetical protein